MHHDLADDLELRITRIWSSVLRPTFSELSRTSTSVLATLRDRGPCRVTELAAREAVAQPTMTTLVGRLEREGLAERRPDPADGRAVQVAITDQGRALLRRLQARRAAAMAARLEQLDAGQRELLAAALPALEALTAPVPEGATA
jgi:DNA-binding MarR family transcriptional regulator